MLGIPPSLPVHPPVAAPFSRAWSAPINNSRGPIYHPILIAILHLNFVSLLYLHTDTSNSAQKQQTCPTFLSLNTHTHTRSCHQLATSAQLRATRSLPSRRVSPPLCPPPPNDQDVGWRLRLSSSPCLYAHSQTPPKSLTPRTRTPPAQNVSSKATTGSSTSVTSPRPTRGTRPRTQTARISASALH